MKYQIFFLIVIVAVLAWCPWLSKDEALQLIDARLASMQEQNPDLCAMTVHKETIRKVLFGYSENVSYDCRLNDSVYGVEESSNVVTVTFYKGIIGMPTKVLKKSL